MNRHGRASEETQRFDPSDLCPGNPRPGSALGPAALVWRLRALADSRLDPSRLQLEITESIALQESERVDEVLERMQALGVELHLDDFGTGYSSLSYLLRYPVDVLKIDRSAVDGVSRCEDSAKIVRLTISLARSLGLELIAEGVETPEQLEFLRREGCPAAQGLLLARPLPPAEIEQFLTHGGVKIAALLGTVGEEG